MELPEGFVKHTGGPCPDRNAHDVILRSGLMPFVSYLFEGWAHGDEQRWHDVIAYKPTEGQQP